MAVDGRQKESHMKRVKLMEVKTNGLLYPLLTRDQVPEDVLPTFEDVKDGYFLHEGRWFNVQQFTIFHPFEDWLGWFPATKNSGYVIRLSDSRHSVQVGTYSTVDVEQKDN